MNIYELRDRVLALPALEKKIEFLSTEIQAAETTLETLLKQYERESRDVKNLQEESFSAFLLRIIGKYEGKLEKEQCEEAAAKTAYDRAAARLEALRDGKNELAASVSALRDDKRTYEAELHLRRAEIEQNLSASRGEAYVKLRDERAALISQITEINEALKALSRARDTAEKTAKSLDNAEDWAAFDTFLGGGLLTDIAKYDSIDTAEENFSRLSSDLSALKSELNDVEALQISGLEEISPGQRAVDFWFDNIFTDWSVLGTIQDNAKKIKQLIENMSRAEGSLKFKLQEKEALLLQNNQNEEALLLSAAHEFS